MEHTLNEILEGFGEESGGLVLRMTLPENVSSVGCETFVEWITWGGRVEWRMLGDHDEKDDGSGEQVDRSTQIWLLLVDLRSHVVWSTQLGVKEFGSISSVNWGSKSKVRNLDIVLTDQDILGLQISVGNTIEVAVIKTTEELLEIESSDSFREFTTLGNVVEQLTAVGDLKNDVVDGLLFAVCFDVFSLTVRDHFNYI